jgi:signal transduction histidine kinase
MDAQLALAVALFAGAVCALLLALLASRARRVARLSAALAAFEHAPRAAPCVVADAGGDALDRLAGQLERLTQRVAAQRDELDRAAARRRELLANVSHDLRTPLAAMQGYLELLLLRQGSLEATEARNYLETAVRQCERLSRLVGELFELSRLEADEVEPRAEDFMLAELAQDVAQKFALDARRRKIELRAAACAEAVVRADIGLIERVLENLLENALRHTPAGGAVTIELERDAARASMAVRDTGQGLAADELATLFERYERADRSRAGGPGGLGLAIAQRIVRLHGGELRVQSERGRGTRFAFDLPLAAGPGRGAG